MIRYVNAKYQFTHMYIQRILTFEYLNSLLQRPCKISAFVCFSAPTHWNLLVNDEIISCQLTSNLVFFIYLEKKFERYYFYYFILCYVKNRKNGLRGSCRRFSFRSVRLGMFELFFTPILHHFKRTLS